MYKRLGIETRLASTADELHGAERVILPGVGAFDHAVTLLEQSGMRPALTELVLGRKTPLLGICVGMQLLAHGSDEGQMPGLGWIPGKVRSFTSAPAAAKLPQPHMGWNEVRPVETSPLLRGFEEGARFYFLHSYFFEVSSGGATLALAHYGQDFSAIVNCGNVYGVQCHPEKSHHWGTQLLKNFAEIHQC
jgi:glutamine amidotransferase